MNYNPPGSSVQGIIQARILGRGWGGVLLPSPGDLPHPGLEPVFPALADRFFTTESPGKPGLQYTSYKTGFLWGFFGTFI